MRVLSLVALALGLALTAPAAAQQPRSQGTQAARPAPAPPRAARPAAKEAPVPFRVGETLTYDVAYQTFLVAGSAVSRVVEKRRSSNSTAYYIVAEGRPLPIIARIYSLYYKMDSLLDSYSVLSQQSSLYAEEGTSRRSATTTFDRRTRRARYELRTDTVVKNEFAVPQNVQDGLATLYSLRGRTFKAGDRLSVPVADDGSLYTASFEVSGPEPVKVPLGQVNAWNLRVSILNAAKEPVGSNVVAWITADAQRLPVKLQADLPVGKFALALRTVEQAPAQN